MASKSSLLQKWHPAYQPSASEIPLKMARHPAYQIGGFHPQICTHFVRKKINKICVPAHNG